MDRKLNFLKVAISLISLHYGLGFLLGTSEAVFNSGVLGLTYPLSCAAGLFLLSLISKFYWERKYPIWTLLGMSFGERVREGVCFLSWFWMIGIVASQVLGASFILGILGIPLHLGVVLTIIVISVLSLLPLEKLSNVFLLLLVLNSIAVIIGISKVVSAETFKWILTSMTRDFSSRSFLSILGVAVPTIFITLLGMDFHQFIVQAETPKQAFVGSIVGGLGLVLMTFLPVLITFGAINKGILPLGIDGKQVIPFVFLREGEKLGLPFLGKFLVVLLLTASLGSGSALTRILTLSFFDFSFIPSKLRSKRNILLINSFVVFFLALTGRTIISLIVCFYAIYLSGVAIPFVVYVVGLGRSKNLIFSKQAVNYSLIVGFTTSLLILVFSLLNVLPPVLSKNLELFMILLGVFFSVLVLFVYTIIGYFSRFRVS